MLNRRAFISAAACLGVAHAVGAQSCGPTPYGPACTAQVDIPNHIEAIHTQDCPEWCWAASISMIFGFYDHQIDQEEIVRQVYGRLQCFPAGTLTIGQALSRTWTDSDGQKFKSKVVAGFDPMNGIVAINNRVIVNELVNDRPVLYCNTHHAMLIYRVDYFPTPIPNIQGVGVIDPWPSSPRLHPLNRPEIFPIPQGQMTFLATVRVEDVD